MNRRNFLQLIGLAVGAAAIPTEALVAFVEEKPDAPIVPMLSACGDDFMTVVNVSMEQHYHDVGLDFWPQYRQIIANSGRVNIEGKRKPNFHKVYEHFNERRLIEWTMACGLMNHRAVWTFTAMVESLEESSTGEVAMKLYFTGPVRLEMMKDDN